MSASTGSSKFRDSIEFLHCLHFAIVNSEYFNIILKPKQVLCLEAVYHGQDLLAVLPTGYGKSLILHLLSSLIAEKNRTDVLEKPVIIVISPLNLLINDQLQKINRLRQRAVVLSVKGHDSHESKGQEQTLDLTNVDASRLKKGDYEYIFTHPETCLSSKQGVSLFQSNVYKNSVLCCSCRRSTLHFGMVSFKFQVCNLCKFLNKPINQMI